MEWLIVNGERWLVNTDSPSCEWFCEQVLKQYPTDAVVDFKEAKYEDFT